MEQLKIFDLIRGEEPRNIGKTVFDTRGRARGAKEAFRGKNSSEKFYSFSDEQIYFPCHLVRNIV